MSGFVGETGICSLPVVTNKLSFSPISRAHSKQTVCESRVPIGCRELFYVGLTTGVPFSQGRILAGRWFSVCQERSAPSEQETTEVLGVRSTDYTGTRRRRNQVSKYFLVPLSKPRGSLRKWKINEGVTAPHVFYLGQSNNENTEAGSVCLLLLFGLVNTKINPILLFLGVRSQSD